MRAFTLIEVVVALVLLEIGLLGVLGTLLLGSRTMTRAETLENAVVAVERAADSLAVHGMQAPGWTAFAGGRVIWTEVVGETRLVALGEAGDTLARMVVEVPR